MSDYKNIVLVFTLIETVCLTFVFLLVYLKWLLVNDSIGTKMENPEIPGLVPDQLETKTMSKHVVKKLLSVIRDVPNR